MIKPEFYLNKNLINSKLITEILDKIEFRFINNLMNREENKLYKYLHKIVPKKKK